MEDNQQQQEQQTTLFDLEVDHLAQTNLYEVSRWARTISMISFTLLGLFLLIFAVAGAALLNRLPIGAEISSNEGIILTLIVVVIIALVAVWIYFLYKASGHIRRGMETSDQKTFNEGLRALKTYFIIGSVIAILSLLSTLTDLF